MGEKLSCCPSERKGIREQWAGEGFGSGEGPGEGKGLGERRRLRKDQLKAVEMPSLGWQSLAFMEQWQCIKRFNAWLLNVWPIDLQPHLAAGAKCTISGPPRSIESEAALKKEKKKSR